MDSAMNTDFDGPFRARSNTWPLPRPDIPGIFSVNCEINVERDLTELSTGVDVSTYSETVIPTVVGNELPGGSESPCGLLPGTQSGQPKKNSSRRNAWGNTSYADLITQAIQSSPDERLTLSQIYDWLVQNVPYFKDKGESNSSAGWKNSIRHNLSLHNRFKRVQNEGTGKSSWWVINPEAKTGKAARRRATSMETQKYEKKRGRVKKKVEAARKGLVLDNTPSPSSSVSEGLDRFPESPLLTNFQLSPEFRPRASSNASSCGGRLSPIPVELPDSHVGPVSPLWNSNLYTSDLDTKELVEMANTMQLGGKSYLNVTKFNGVTPCGGSMSPTPSLNSVNKSYTNLTNFGSAQANNPYTTNGGATLTRNGSDPYFQTTQVDSITLTALNSSPSPSKVLSSDSLENGANNSTFNLNMSPSLSPSQSLDTLSGQKTLLNTSTTTFQSKQSPSQQNGNPINQAVLQNRVYGSSPGLDTSALRRLNNNKILSTLDCTGINNDNNNGFAGLGATATHVMGQILNNPSLPNDLDFPFDTFQGGLECDVDQVIRHELSVDGTLDFNFDPNYGSSTNSVQSNGAPTSVSSHSWVH